MWSVALLLKAATALSTCDPLDPSLCMLPFPNNFWLRPSPKAGGALRLQFTNLTFPLDREGKAIFPQEGGWNELDGFSCFMPITTFLPTSKGATVSLDNTAPWGNIEKSLSVDSPTVLLDTTTGERLPHWVELDHSSDDGYPNRTYDRTFIIWPTKKLEFGRRYIVGLRGLVDTKGVRIAPSEAFGALRDKVATTNPDVEERRSLFEDIFARLAKAGFGRSSLILAWDFTTVSQHQVLGRIQHMRDDGLARLPKNGPKFTVKSNTNFTYNSKIARLLEVEIQVPQFVDKNLPGAELVLDSNGVPTFQKFGGSTVSVLIPQAVADGTFKPEDVSVLQYGHGLFGSRHEAKGSYLMELSDRYGYVVIATDWIGMSEEDAAFVGLVIATDFTKFGRVPDRTQQGFLLALTAMRLMGNPEFLAHPAMQPKGKPILGGTTKRFYYGNSQGGIFGTCYMAITTDVTRGVIGVGGAPYSLLLPRSHDFAFPFFDDMKARYGEPKAIYGLLSVIQLLWDRAEPGGYMGSITENMLPGTPKHEVLLQDALGDNQVTVLGGYSIARTVGASVFESNAHEPEDKPFGFPVVKDTAVAKGALLSTWFYPDVPPMPHVNVPPTARDTHEGPRRERLAQDQMDHFFKTGEIVNNCGGKCVGKVY